MSVSLTLGEWSDALDKAREASLGLSADDNVPRGRLATTLVEMGHARNTAQSLIDSAFDSGLIVSDESGVVAAYALGEAPEEPSEDEAPLDVKAHYERVRPVYEALGDLDGHPTIILTDFSRWYVTRSAPDSLRDLGYDGVGRPATVGDYSELVNRVERTMYAITSYKTPESLDRETAFKNRQGGREWADRDKKTPTYAEIVGYPMFGDIDLTKTKDSNGQVRGIREIRFEEGLDDQTRQTIEATIDAYVDEYARLYGSRDGVQVLDSGGGVYVFGPPEATMPIAEEFAGDEAALKTIFSELRSREKDYLREAQARVEERVDGSTDVISPDWCNNCNRQYKGPLALHKNADVVVTPIDTEDVSFDLTWASDVDDELIAQSVDWAREFTTPTHTSAVENMVSAFWSEEYDEAGDWAEALRNWIEAKRKRDLRQEQERQQDRTDTSNTSEIAARYQTVEAKINQLDAERVAEKTIVGKWNDDAGTGGNNRAFWPTWGNIQSDSGTANYINPDKGIWNDTGDGGWGTVVEMALIAANELDWRTATPTNGAQWSRGVRELARRGFDVPIWTPDATTRQAKDGKMPLWSLRAAAVALGVVDEDDFVQRESDDGDSYPGFPDAGTYNAALEAVEAAGLKHGRKPAGDGSARPTRKQLGLDEVSEDPDERMKQLHAELEMMN